MKILIIEDNEILRGIISQVAQDLGHESICPSTYKDGLAQLGKEKFDVVIVESSPDECPWFKPMQIIDDNNGKAMESFVPFLWTYYRWLSPMPEIIFVSKKGFSAEAKFAIDSGAVDYIHVPVDITESGIKTAPADIKGSLIKAINHAAWIVDGSYIEGLDLEGIVGNSWVMKRALLRLSQASRVRRTRICDIYERHSTMEFAKN